MYYFELQKVDLKRFRLLLPEDVVGESSLTRVCIANA